MSSLHLLQLDKSLLISKYISCVWMEVKSCWIKLFTLVVHKLMPKNDAKAGNNAEAKVENGKLVITGLAALTYDTQLTMTYKGTVKVGNSEVWTSIPVTVSVVNE